VGLSISLLWPATVSLSAAEIPRGGTAMFALLALAGDAGCGLGPALCGFLADARGGALQSGLIAALIFPALILLSILARLRYERKTVAKAD
jgi:fucose permease